jgi:hypothetical protein
MPARWQGLEEPPWRKPRERPKWDCPWAVVWCGAALWAAAFAFHAHHKVRHLEAAHQLVMDSLTSLSPDTVWGLPAGWSEAYQLQCYWLPPGTDGTEYTVIRQQEQP